VFTKACLPVVLARTRHHPSAEPWIEDEIRKVGSSLTALPCLLTGPIIDYMLIGEPTAHKRARPMRRGDGLAIYDSYLQT
jgi:hypothetical protein